MGSFDEDYRNARAGGAGPFPTQGEWKAINDMRREEVAAAEKSRSETASPIKNGAWSTSATSTEHPASGRGPLTSRNDTPRTPSTTSSTALAGAVIAGVITAIWATTVANLPAGYVVGYVSLAAIVGAVAGVVARFAVQLLIEVVQVAIGAAVLITVLDYLGWVDGGKILRKILALF